jgi:hypothetical protein
MNTLTVKVADNDVVFTELNIMQIVQIERTPVEPEPEPSQEWIESGLPKEQSKDWKTQHDNWLDRMRHDRTVRMLGLSFAIATIKDNHNKGFISALEEISFYNWFVGKKLPIDAGDQIDLGYWLINAVKALGGNPHLYQSLDDNQDDYPLSKILRWLELRGGLILDPKLVEMYRKSLQLEGERGRTGNSGAENIPNNEKPKRKRK